MALLQWLKNIRDYCIFEQLDIQTFSKAAELFTELFKLKDRHSSIDAAISVYLAMALGCLDISFGEIVFILDFFSSSRRSAKHYVGDLDNAVQVLLPYLYTSTLWEEYALDFNSPPHHHPNQIMTNLAIVYAFRDPCQLSPEEQRDLIKMADRSPSRYYPTEAITKLRKYCRQNKVSFSLHHGATRISIH